MDQRSEVRVTYISLAADLPNAQQWTYVADDEAWLAAIAAGLDGTDVMASDDCGTTKVGRMVRPAELAARLTAEQILSPDLGLHPDDRLALAAAHDSSQTFLAMLNRFRLTAGLLPDYLCTAMHRLQATGGLDQVPWWDDLEGDYEQRCRRAIRLLTAGFHFDEWRTPAVQGMADEDLSVLAALHDPDLPVAAAG